MGTADEASKYPPSVVKSLKVHPPLWATKNSCGAGGGGGGGGIADDAGCPGVGCADDDGGGIPLAKVNSDSEEGVAVAWVTWANSWGGGPPVGTANLLIADAVPTGGTTNPFVDGDDADGAADESPLATGRSN